ncbi:MAG: glycosyltransferase family 4 protein [candidate division KSB1 bacterium]|nr:glycosyltransferase family 4 protein [candidate division KSB1 bacterium]
MMKRILYFNYMNDLYGSSIGSTIKALKLLGGLEKHGWKVTFAWRRDGWNEPSGKLRHRTTFFYSFFRRILFTPKQLVLNLFDFVQECRLARRLKPELIIARLDAFRISSLGVARLFKIPLIVEADGACSYEWIHYHGGPHLWKQPLLFCEKLMLRFADGIFTQSNVSRAYYEQTHGRWKTKVIVIPNGADPVEQMSESETEAIRCELNLHNRDVIIGFLGSMHKWHGLQEVRDLLVELLCKQPHVKLMFVGGGGTQIDFIDSFPSLLRERIVFVRTVPYELVGRYISLFSIAVAPYPPMPLFYFSPVKIFDYMAAGKAIVAPRLGQIGEVLQHEVNALLYAPGDFLEFYHHISTLSRDEALRTRLGKQARETFMRAYTWDIRSAELDRFLRRRLSSFRPSE